MATSQIFMEWDEYSFTMVTCDRIYQLYTALVYFLRLLHFEPKSAFTAPTEICSCWFGNVLCPVSACCSVPTQRCPCNGHGTVKLGISHVIIVYCSALKCEIISWKIPNSGTGIILIGNSVFSCNMPYFSRPDAAKIHTGKSWITRSGPASLVIQRTAFSLFSF